MAEIENEVLDLSEILQVRRDKLAALREAGKDPYEITKYDVTNHAKELIDEFESYEGKNVSVAGRLMSKRGMGKASFCDLLDKTGKIQLYLRIDEVGEENYEETGLKRAF